jgi:hypothetical protein
VRHDADALINALELATGYAQRLPPPQQHTGPHDPYPYPHSHPHSPEGSSFARAQRMGLSIEHNSSQLNHLEHVGGASGVGRDGEGDVSLARASTVTHDGDEYEYDEDVVGGAGRVLSARGEQRAPMRM